LIPKCIHYCWFGGARLPKSAGEYILTWKKQCPDYKIIEWNEKNFDLKSNTYCSEAYKAGKWAFITDYVRLWAIFNYGGIYMDTDVEVLKPLDIFLKHPAFSGFESNSTIPTGIMGGIAGHSWYKKLLAYYHNRHFILPDNGYDMTTNVTTITNITGSMYDIILNNTFQEFDDGLVFYPSDYFCPKSKTGSINKIVNTYTIHHFAGSWTPKPTRVYVTLRDSFVKSFGYTLGRILAIPVFVVTKLLTDGFPGLKAAFKNKLSKSKQ
jgi:mannosyltransferase OCH1-like enzyme